MDCVQCCVSGSVESVSFPWIRIRIKSWVSKEGQNVTSKKKNLHCSPEGPTKITAGTDIGSGSVYNYTDTNPTKALKTENKFILLTLFEKSTVFIEK